MRSALILLLLPALSAGCSDYEYSQPTHEDVFIQNQLNTVDLLLVVDNSCSMVEEQSKLAGNFDSFIQYFDEAEVDWQLGVITTDVDQAKFSGHLIGGDDEIVLADAGGREIDRVEYDRDWPVGPGVVLSLDPSYFAATSNDSASKWCVDVAATPGASNPGCAGTGPGTDASRGAVIITEFAPDPDGVADAAGEWVELTNISAETVDLTGYSLLDDGRNLYAFPDGTMLAAGEALVLGRTLDVEGADLAVGTDFTLNNHDLFLTAATAEPEEIFAEMVAQGITGSGIEMGLEAVRLAITEPLRSVAADGTGANDGFIRDEANFSVLIVSDEEDSSPLPVNDYLSIYADMKGEDAYRNHARMNVSAVIGDRAPEFEGEPSCSSANGQADWGRRYLRAVEETVGLVDSICDDDFSPIVNELGLTLSGLQADFALSGMPRLDSLKVSIYADADESSKIRDLTLDVDYSYIEEENLIRFELDQVPESQQYILVEYQVQSGSN
ncbi:MAG: lamin tail domain-containing protein [Pseudomonadota bacterium]|nr:lamin tail domain-containing protein [Pseudomonadota bacterium]